MTGHGTSPAAASSFKRTLMLWLWLASMAAVVAGSLLPVSGPPVVPHFDKIQHFAGYAWLAVLPWAAFAGPGTASRMSLAMFALGGAIEVAQQFVPGRCASLADLLANGVGVACGWWWGWRRIRTGRERGAGRS